MLPSGQLAKLPDRLREVAPRTIEETADYAVFQVDFSKMFRRLRGPSHVLAMTYGFAEDKLSNDAAWLEDKCLTLRSTEDLLPVLLVGPATRQSVQYVHRALAELDYMEGQPRIGADALLGRANPDLRKLLLAETGYGLLSPYRINECAASRMFFGRERDLSELKADTSNLVLVGARRVGKSSLVLRLKESLGALRVGGDGFRYPAREVPRCVYVDVGKIAAPVGASLWYELSRRFNIERRDLRGAGWRSDLLGKRPKASEIALLDETKALQGLFARFHGKLTIVLDEVDAWIHEEADRLWPSIHTLRSFTDNGRARVILVGYESLAVAARYHKFPLTERGQTKILGALDFGAVKDLILEPLDELRVKIEPRSKEQILNRIWKTTSGFPHLVQDILGNVVKLTLDDRARGRERPVTMATLESAISQSAALKAFLQRIVDKDFPLARAIAAVCALSGRSSANQGDSGEGRALTVGEIARRLEEDVRGFEYSESDFELALTALELRAVLQPANAERTRWLWVNELARKSMEVSFRDVGHKRFFEDLVREHEEGKWRGSFKKLRWGGAPK